MRRNIKKEEISRMKFPSKITLLAVLTILLGSTVCAYAFFAPSVNPTIFNTQKITEMALRADSQRLVPSSEAYLVPDARPYSLDIRDNAQKLFDHSA